MANGGHDDAAGPPPAGPEASPQVLADNRQGAAAAPPKEPGWYPVRTNPNEQTYWDGNDWTRRRRWSPGTGWAEVGPGPATTTAVPGLAVPGGTGPVMTGAGMRLSANPYAPQPAPTTSATRPAPGVTLGLMLLICSAVAMMVGSVTTWVSSSSSIATGSLLGGVPGVSHTVSSATSGVDAGVSTLIGVNGYLTLIAAVVVLVFAGLMAVSDDLSVRLIGCLFAFVSLGLSIYVVVRLVQKINGLHSSHGTSVSLGWGAILMLAAAVVATLITLFEVTKNR
jgi:hypothetical protein